MTQHPVITAGATSFVVFLALGLWLVYHPWHLGHLFEYLETRRITT